MHSANVVLDAALQDLEGSIADEDDDSLSAIAALLERLEALPVPPGSDPAVSHLQAIGRHLPALTLPGSGPWRASSTLDVNGKLAGMATTCPKCRHTYYVGDSLRDWMRVPEPRPRTVVATTPDHDARILGPEWPANARQSRVRLYKHLTAVLAS